MRHTLYTTEAAERCIDESLAHRLTYGRDELSALTLVVGETSYRRGFCQGFGEALVAIADKIPPRVLVEFLNRDLAAWRGQRHEGEFERPPTF